MDDRSHRSQGHHGFSHDALSALAYDWERVGDPGIAARWPFKVYLPANTAEVVRAVQETAGDLVIRGSGHSSNGLVTAEGGTLLLTERLDAVSVDEEALTCTMQAGARLSEVDAELARHGLGLKVIGDHGELTAGGFASVGGISPASHRHGMFVDTVVALEYVDFSGQVHRCTRDDVALRRVLAGLGRHGVITELTVEVLRIRKESVLLRNERYLTGRLPEFLARAAEMAQRPDPALFARAMWADLGNAGFGQVSTYYETTSRPVRAARGRLGEAYQQLVGAAVTRLRGRAAAVAKYAGVAGMLLPPTYTTVARVETFADDLTDATVGDPTRLLIVLAPAEVTAEVAQELLDVCADARESGAIGPVALYVKPVLSDYLGGRFAELTVVLTVDPDWMTTDVLADLVKRVDEVTVERGALRYMHTRTSKDMARLVDPNARYVEGDGGR